MAIVRPIIIDAATGSPFREIDVSADDFQADSFVVFGSPGIALNSAGLNLNSGTISGAGNITFATTANGIVQTSGGTLAYDDLVGKDRNNTIGSAGAILFPLILDTASMVDAFQIPRMAGAPTATPAANSGAGYMVYDDTNNNLYVWDGAAWVNQDAAGTVGTSYIAATGINAGVAVYINSACQVLPALATAESNARVIGFTLTSAASGVSVSVITDGTIGNQTLTTNIGARYFLGTATASIVTAIPTDNNHQVIQVGYAANSTTLQIQIVPLAIRRA